LAQLFFAPGPCSASSSARHHRRQSLPNRHAASSLSDNPVSSLISVSPSSRLLVLTGLADFRRSIMWTPLQAASSASVANAVRLIPASEAQRPQRACRETSTLRLALTVLLDGGLTSFRRLAFGMVTVIAPIRKKMKPAGGNSRVFSFIDLEHIRTCGRSSPAWSCSCYRTAIPPAFSPVGTHKRAIDSRDFMDTVSLLVSRASMLVFVNIRRG
jgi:hypothetical protein